MVVTVFVRFVPKNGNGNGNKCVPNNEMRKKTKNSEERKKKRSPNFFSLFSEFGTKSVSTISTKAGTNKPTRLPSERIFLNSDPLFGSKHKPNDRLLLMVLSTPTISDSFFYHPSNAEPSSTDQHLLVNKYYRWTDKDNGKSSSTNLCCNQLI